MDSIHLRMELGVLMDWAEDLASFGFLMLLLGIGAALTAAVLLAFINAVDFFENVNDK